MFSPGHFMEILRVLLLLQALVIEKSLIGVLGLVAEFSALKVQISLLQCTFAMIGVVVGAWY